MQAIKKAKLKGKNPIMYNEQILTEIVNRTNVPKEFVRQAIRAYYEIVTDCLMAGVDVKLGNLGVIGTYDQEPGMKKYYDITDKKVVERFKPGHRALKFYLDGGLKNNIKISTWYWPEGYEPTEEETAYMRKVLEKREQRKNGNKE